MGNQQITLPYLQLKSETQNERSDEKNIPFRKTEFWENPITNENQVTVSPDPQKNGSKNYDVSIYIYSAGIVQGLHVLAGVVNGRQEWSMGGRSGQWVASLSRGGQWVASLSRGGQWVAGVDNGWQEWSMGCIS